MIRIQARLKARATVIRSSDYGHQIVGVAGDVQAMFGADADHNHALVELTILATAIGVTQTKVHRSNSSAISATQDDLLLSQWRGIGLVVQAPFSDIPARPTHLALIVDDIGQVPRQSRT